MENKESKKTVKTLQKDFEKEFHPGGLASASIQHFLQTGRVSGGLSVFLEDQAKSFYNAGLMCQRIIAQSQAEAKDNEINQLKTALEVGGNMYKDMLDMKSKVHEEVQALKTENAAIAKHNADLLKTIERGEEALALEKHLVHFKNTQAELREKVIEGLKSDNVRAGEMQAAIHEAIQVLEHYDTGEDFALFTSLKRLRAIEDTVDQVESTEIEEHDCTDYAKINCRCPKGACKLTRFYYDFTGDNL